MDTAPFVPMWSRTRAALAVAGAFSFYWIAVPSHAQTAPAPAASAQAINTSTASCRELKSRLQNSGTLTLVSGSQGWGDTYYARAPQCEFWQRPVFTSVMASDGWCAVGYVCAAKISGR